MATLLFWVGNLAYALDKKTQHSRSGFDGKVDLTEESWFPQEEMRARRRGRDSVGGMCYSGQWTEDVFGGRNGSVTSAVLSVNRVTSG